MPRRQHDWLRQGEKDLQHAKNSLSSGDYEWACFAAQQACEKALKALYYSIGGEGWGHSLTKLLKELPENLKVDEITIKSAMNLDKHYIPARYPNGFDTGAPMDYYSREDAEESIRNAEIIFKFVKINISE